MIWGKSVWAWASYVNCKIGWRIFLPLLTFVIFLKFLENLYPGGIWRQSCRHPFHDMFFPLPLRRLFFSCCFSVFPLFFRIQFKYVCVCVHVCVCVCVCMCVWERETSLAFLDSFLLFTPTSRACTIVFTLSFVIICIFVCLSLNCGHFQNHRLRGFSICLRCRRPRFNPSVG